MSKLTKQPLVVAVTGHRDLIANECDGIRGRTRDFFNTLRLRYPDLDVQLMSPLAEGADQLAAEVALDLGIPIIVPLPMPVGDYLQDFSSQDGVDRFNALYDQATNLFVLSSDSAEKPRADTYAELGIFQASHCHILLAIWDGKESDKLGGTSHVVRFHHDDIMPGYEPKSGVSQQMLVDDESDLVYHIVCSRDRQGGAPAEGLTALSACWFTKDETNPRSTELPAAHDVVFLRASEFSRDAMRFSKQIVTESYPLMTADGEALGIDGLADIDSVFRAADYLAIRYQKKTLRTLRVSHVLAFMMGTLFVLYSDLATWQSLLYAFLMCFVVATAVQAVASRRGWNRKYLDYRTLAEGLRVQFHWAMAGITQRNLEQYSHDNFLQLQDPELGWIRNTMRVAGLQNDTVPHIEDAALSVAMREWVGDSESGQLGYYRKKSEERMHRHRRTEALGRVSLFTSAGVVVLFLVAGQSIPESYVDPLLALMGVTLLLFGVRHAYAHAIAEKELIKQYEFMLRIFVNAKLRLTKSVDDEQRRQILMALGSSALDEHAQWILMNRERSVSQQEIWRIGSGS